MIERSVLEASEKLKTISLHQDQFKQRKCAFPILDLTCYNNNWTQISMRRQVRKEELLVELRMNLEVRKAPKVTNEDPITRWKWSMLCKRVALKLSIKIRVHKRRISNIVTICLDRQLKHFLSTGGIFRSPQSYGSMRHKNTRFKTTEKVQTK